MGITFLLDDVGGNKKTSSATEGRIYITDLKHRAFYCPIKWMGETCLCFEPATEEPVAVHIRYDIEGFGTCWITMDNCGQGYTGSGRRYSLMDELINSRISRIKRRLEGMDQDPEVVSMLGEVEKEMSRGNRQRALYLATVAGEDVEFRKAKGRLDEPQYRTKASFSGTLFGERLGEYAIGVGRDWEGAPPDFLRPVERWNTITGVVNATTLPTFWRWIEPERGEFNFGPLDRMVAFCRERSIAMKSFALYWGGIGGTPVWFRSLDLKQQLTAVKEWMKVLIDRYGGYIQIYEVVNEMHDWKYANPKKYSHKELLEITASVCRWAGELAPGRERIINNCMPWGEYCQELQGDCWVPLTFLEEVAGQGIEFEGVGIQYYFPGRDIMELGAHIDRFASFGKTVHITEMGTPSAAGDRQEVETGQVDLMNGWRGVWNEERQADWMEMLYTIAMSRDAIRTLNYWDVDDTQAFIKYAGILDADGNPKCSYERLLRLKEKYLPK
jgi:Beta-1,4-xylanase